MVQAEASTATSTPPATREAAPIAITPELVRTVAEKVYALWLLDLKIERERWRTATVRSLQRN